MMQQPAIHFRRSEPVSNCIDAARASFSTSSASLPRGGITTVVSLHTLELTRGYSDR